MVVTISLTGNYRANLQGSGTITLEELYQWLYTSAGDLETYMTRTGTPGVDAVYEAQYGSTGYFQIYIGVNGYVTFEMEDTDTYHTTWSGTSTTTWVIYVYQRGTMKMGKGCTIDNNINSGTYGRGRFGCPGTFISSGTETNPNYMLHMRDYYFYMQYITPWDVNWTTFGRTENRTYTSWTFRLGVEESDFLNKQRSIAHSFKNCTCYDYNKYGYMYFYYNMEKWVIENFTIDNMYRTYYWHTSVKLKNCTFKNSRDHDYLRLSSDKSVLEKYKTNAFGLNGYMTHISNQPMLVYDECTWDNNDYGSYGCIARRGTVCLLKNCTIQNQTYPIYTNENSKVLYYGTNNGYNSGTRTWNNGGAHLWVRMLTLTVVDNNNDPIENVIVSIKTKLTKTIDGRSYSREEWCFSTDENGKVLRADGEGIFLVEKEETSNGIFAQWSDGNGDNVHILTITHPDYGMYSEEIVMNQDRTITINLSDAVAGSGDTCHVYEDAKLKVYKEGVVMREYI